MKTKDTVIVGFSSLIILSLIFLLLLTSCTPNITSTANSVNSNQQDVRFAVYLLPSNQLIFSEDDLISYSAENDTFMFTPEGAKKMKAYQTSPTINAGLYQNEFVMKFGDEELYRGKFSTGLSSFLDEGIFLSDIVLISENYPVLRLEKVSLSDDDSFNAQELDDSKLIEHFKKIEKLKE